MGEVSEEIVFKTRVDTGSTAQDIDNNITKPLSQSAQSADAAQKEFDELRKEIKSTSKEVEDLSKKYGKNSKEVEKATKDLEGLNSAYKALSKNNTDVSASFEDIHGELQPLSTRISEAEDRMHQLTLENKAGGQEYKALEANVVTYKKAIIETDRAVDRLVEGGTLLGPALQIGETVVAGYAAAQGAAALLGNENENLQETFVKIQAAQAVLSGIQAIRLNLDKQSIIVTKAQAVGNVLLSATQAAYATVVGTTTGALKLLRIAIIATGIGALIIGVVLLVTNFKAISRGIANGTKKMGAFGKMIKRMLVTAFWPLILAYKVIMFALKALGLVEDDAAKNSSKAHEKRVSQAEERIAKEKELQAQLKKAHEAEQKNLDRLISLAAASGKSTVELTKKKINGSIEFQKQQIKEIENNLRMIETAGKFGFSELLQDQLKEQKQFLTDAVEGIKDSENELLVIDAEVKKKLADEGKKAADDRKKLEEAEATKRKEREKLIQDFFVQSIKDEEMRKLGALTLSHKRQRDAIRLKFGEDAELLKRLQAKQDEELLALNAEFEQKKTAQQIKDAETERQNKLAQLEGEIIQARNDFEKELSLQKELAELKRDQELEDEELTEGAKFKIREEFNARIEELNQKSADKQKKLDKEVVDAKIETEKQALGAIQNLSDIIFLAKNSNLKKGSKAEEDAARKQFNFNKALQLGGAVIDAQKAIIASLASAPIAIGGIPNPAGIASLAFVGIQSAATIAKIASTKFEGSASGGGTSVGAPNIPTASDTSGGADGADTTLTDDIPGVGGGGGSDGGGTDSQVKIVDSAMKIQLAKSAKVEDTASFG